MPFANFKVPAGTLNAEQKETIVHRTTDLYAELYGDRVRASTMVLVEEVTDGGWGIGDRVLTLAVLGGSGASSAAGSSSASSGADGS
jgi:4-oxalocrotonate tautomerase